MKTWHVEAAVIAGALSLVVVLTGNHPVQWVGALAVWITSRHMSVADRLREAHEHGRPRSAECAGWLDRYWVSKEVLWAIYFVSMGAWSALVGAGLFMAYPFWRRAWRRWRPVNRGSENA